MRPIYIRREFQAQDLQPGYLEVIYENHSSVAWRHYVPDPRKKKHHCSKWWWLEGGFGSADGLCHDSSLCGVALRAREFYLSRHKAVKEMLMEAGRRYDRRYTEFGELANAQMPPDPERQEVIACMLEMIRPKLQVLLCGDLPLKFYHESH